MVEQHSIMWGWCGGAEFETADQDKDSEREASSHGPERGMRIASHIWYEADVAVPVSPIEAEMKASI
jgi:hypothetical protein